MEKWKTISDLLLESSTWYILDFQVLLGIMVRFDCHPRISVFRVALLADRSIGDYCQTKERRDRQSHVQLHSVWNGLQFKSLELLRTHAHA